jgi:hypothetical protein
LAKVLKIPENLRKFIFSLVFFQEVDIGQVFFIDSFRNISRILVIFKSFWNTSGMIRSNIKEFS